MVNRALGIRQMGIISFGELKVLGVTLESEVSRTGCINESARQLLLVCVIIGALITSSCRHEQSALTAPLIKAGSGQPAQIEVGNLSRSLDSLLGKSDYAIMNQFGLSKNDLKDDRVQCALYDATNENAGSLPAVSFSFNKHHLQKISLVFARHDVAAKAKSDRRKKPSRRYYSQASLMIGADEQTRWNKLKMLLFTNALTEAKVLERLGPCFYMPADRKLEFDSENFQMCYDLGESVYEGNDSFTKTASFVFEQGALVENVLEVRKGLVFWSQPSSIFDVPILEHTRKPRLSRPGR